MAKSHEKSREIISALNRGLSGQASLDLDRGYAVVTSMASEKLTPTMTLTTEMPKARMKAGWSRAYLYASVLNSMGHSDTMPALMGSEPEKDRAIRWMKGRMQLAPRMPSTP